MPKSPFIAAVAAVVALIALPDAASAAPKKKLSYDQAWKHCTAEINKASVPMDQPGSRQAAGASCMKKYGHKI